ncbi:MAG: ethanolamine utilization protein EutN [Acidobacteriia bacterium]|nr:ethanolamine utilization protein EutN [Terriglobia bacterium]MYG03544.1 ethanolamine utilization protein EutN [Terriglobia bacterium]MYK12272.1 ethanolamine utilization protein EutN [Terriglobia bacterium]
MRLARVVGNVCATVKDPQLEGLKLLLLQPIDAVGTDVGTPLVALDSVGAGAGETVYWSGRREACLAFDPQVPSDASVTGIVDSIAGQR